MYPSPEQWRAYAKNAQAMANAYQSEGDHKMARRRSEDADFYEQRAKLEESRLLETQFKEAAE